MNNPVDHVTTRSARARSALASYLAEISDYPLLAKKDELAIAPFDREALVLSNLRFVVKIAAGFGGRGLPMDDLINEGNLGLIRAAERFDPARGNKFITYAAYWIRKALRQALSEQISTVRIPRYQVMKARRQAELKGSEKEDPKGDRPRPIVTSLDEPASSLGERTLADSLEDVASEDPEERAVKLDLLSKISRLLDVLDQRERAVIIRRFGLSGSEGHTLKQIGTVFGLSRERVRQIEREARIKLRDGLEAPRTSRGGDRGKKGCNPYGDAGS